MASLIDIAIIGGGAAGLAASIFAAETNPSLHIAVFDGAKTLGAKILISGGGRCNVTHQRVTASDFQGNRKIIDRILRRFDEQATIRWLNSIGVFLHTEETGKLFPVSNKARTVLDALLGRCQHLSITLHRQSQVQSIWQKNKTFLIQHSQGTHSANQIILATGGRSLPKTGSNGSGWTLVQQLGHTVTPTYPALVPLLLNDSFIHAKLSGISHEVMLTTRVHDRIVDRRNGSLLWTHFGISGPVVMDASRFWNFGNGQGQQVQLYLNCFPNDSFKEIEAWLVQAASFPGRQTVQSLLAERLPNRAATELARLLGPEIPFIPIHILEKNTRHLLVQTLTNLELPVIGSRGWNFAEVTAGGVPLQEINPTSMESKRIPGLYLVGEMLDCDGRIGGFNFQWSWSTGYLAGTHAASTLGKRKPLSPASL